MNEREQGGDWERNREKESGKLRTKQREIERNKECP